MNHNVYYNYIMSFLPKKGEYLFILLGCEKIKPNYHKNESFIIMIKLSLGWFYNIFFIKKTTQKY